jgi:hypothetical protein
MKFSLLWYEALSERFPAKNILQGIKYKQSIQPLMEEIYVLKTPHNPCSNPHL